MLTVYVVMSNDFPDSVFSTEIGAKEYVEQRKREASEPREIFVYWKVYSFVVDNRRTS